MRARKTASISLVSFDISLVDASLEEALLERGFSAATVRSAQGAVRFRPIPPSILPPCGPLSWGRVPPGLFAALFLARCGACPLLVERGFDVDRRRAMFSFRTRGSARSSLQHPSSAKGTGMPPTVSHDEHQEQDGSHGCCSGSSRRVRPKEFPRRSPPSSRQATTSRRS